MNRILPLLLLLPACASLMPVDGTLPIVALKADKAASSRPDVDVVMEPIGYQDVVTHRDLLMKFSWVERDDVQSSRTVQGQGKVAYGVGPILPLPVVAARITNQSKAPLDLHNADIVLVDDKGKRWPVFKDVGAVQGRAWDEEVLRFPNLQSQPQQQELLSNLIAQTKIIDRATVIPAGGQLTGYLVFRLDAQTPNELEKYLTSIQKLTVHIGAIGPDNASIDVPILFDKGQLAVSCEGGKPQTIDTCRQKPYAD